MKFFTKNNFSYKKTFFTEKNLYENVTENVCVTNEI